LNKDKFKLSTKSLKFDSGSNLEKLMKDSNAIKNWEEVCNIISQT